MLKLVRVYEFWNFTIFVWDVKRRLLSGDGRLQKFLRTQGLAENRYTCDCLYLVAKGRRSQECSLTFFQLVVVVLFSSVFVFVRFVFALAILRTCVTSPEHHLYFTSDLQG